MMNYWIHEWVGLKKRSENHFSEIWENQKTFLKIELFIDSVRKAESSALKRCLIKTYWINKWLKWSGLYSSHGTTMEYLYACYFFLDSNHQVCFLKLTFNWKSHTFGETSICEKILLGKIKKCQLWWAVSFCGGGDQEIQSFFEHPVNDYPSF